MSYQLQQVESVCKLVTSGGTPLSSNPSFYEPKEIPWLKTAEVNYCRIYDTENYISEEGLRRSSAKLIPVNSVIVAMYGQGDTAGRVAINKIPLSTNQACCNLVIDDKKADYRFVYYALTTLYEKMVSLKNGGAQPNLNAGIIKAIEIPMPTLHIQKRIADILSTYDDLIENNRKQIKLLEEAAQRLYKEWFVEFRFPGYKKTRIVEGVPERWEIVILDDVLQKITTGLNPRKNFVLGKGENYYVTIKNMGNNDVYLDDKCDRVDDEAINKINNRSDLQMGDFLFSGIGTMGRVYWICIPTDNWNVSESVFTLRANDRISNEYLYMVLLSTDMQNYCDHNAHGAAQRGIRMADLRAYSFLLPSKDIMDKYTRVSQPIIKKTQELRKQNKRLCEARGRLLPKLMSGEIEV